MTPWRVRFLWRPALRFHPNDLLKYLSPEMEIVRVGPAESWRRGLRVVTKGKEILKITQL